MPTTQSAHATSPGAHAISIRNLSKAFGDHVVLRALALGADFVLCGRPYLYGAAARGEAGADHVSHILATDLANNMVQLGVSSLAELRGLACV